MPKDSLMVEWMNEPTKRKKKEHKCATIFQDRRSLRPRIIKLCRREDKSHPRTHISLNNTSRLTLPHHQASPSQQYRVKSCYELSYATSPLWATFIVNQMYCKVEVEWTHLNMKSHVS